MAIQTATHDVLQLLHLAGKSAGMVEHYDGTFRQITNVSLRRQVGIGAIFSGHRAIGATDNTDLNLKLAGNYDIVRLTW